MSRSNDAMAHEVRRWKDRISTLENIPLNPDHKYKDQNDVYERMTVYVKGWIEGMFLKHTDENGELVFNSDREDTQEVKEWMEANNNNMTTLSTGWWDVALKGQENNDESLPHFYPNNLGEKTEKEVRQDVNDGVVQYFFPAYRALKESYDKRWWFEWIFNHKQYTAERDALKVMTNLITSMTGMTKAELKEEYRKNRTVVSPEAVAKANVAKFDRQQALEAEEIEKAMKDPNYGKIKIEPDSALALFNERNNDEKGFYNSICTDLVKVLQGNCILNEAALDKSVPEHIYAPLQEVAKELCTNYDQAKQDGTLDVKAKELIENAAKQMFEKAFKGLATTYAKGAVDTAMTGKPVFGMNSLKAHIIAAQKLTNIMLKGLTPVGFSGKKYEQFAKGYHVWEKSDEVLSFLKETLKDKYTDKQIALEFKGAKNEFGVLYYREKREVSQVYNIGYHPDISDVKKFEDEGKKLRNLQKLIMIGNKNHETIADNSSKSVLGENYKRWEEANELKKQSAKLDTKKMQSKLAKLEAQWANADKILTKVHVSYDPIATEEALEFKLAEAKERQKLKMAVNNDASKTVPPVVPNPAQIGQPKLKQ